MKANLFTFTAHCSNGIRIASCLAGFVFFNGPYAKIDYTQYEGHEISRIILKNLGFTKPEIVIRELELEEGDIFQAEQFDFSLKALEKLDIFAEIVPSVRVKTTGLEISLEFKEIPLFVPHPTGEYTEENGISLGGGIMSTNLWGRNHFLEGSYKRSLMESGVKRASLEYHIPRFSGSRIKNTLWIADERRENKLLGFGEIYQTARWRLFWTLFYGLNIRVITKWEMSFEITEADSNGFTLSTSGRDALPGLGPSLILDARNYSGNPTEGYFLELGFLNFSGPLGGDGHYVQGLLDIRVYQPLSQRQHFIVSHLTTLQSGQFQEDIPVYRGFWFGGGNSVRGFGLKEQMGRNQTIFTMEYSYLLVPSRAIPLYVFDWYVDLGLQPILGLDAGTTWNGKLGENGWLYSVTAGLQILVPYIQMARIEFGLGRFFDPEGISFQLHMSAESKARAQRYRRR